MAVVTIGFILAAALLVWVAWKVHTRKLHALRSELTKSIGDLRAERDAAILAVRWVPMVNAEFTALAKSGCNNCNGLGYIKGSAKVRGVDGKLLKNDKDEELVRAFTKVCVCVYKAMANNPKYGAVADGVPVRLATKEEVEAQLAHEAQQTAPREKYDNVIPIESTKS
jgi:hypothetical protein